MGSTASRLVEQERVKWAIDHSLQIDRELQQQQIALLHNFGPVLRMFSKKETYLGVAYMHFYVTGDQWTIEFGGGELSNASVLVHDNPKDPNALLVSEERKTPERLARMRSVCGARGYSLALRNCEHLARYIMTGSWTSMQMLDKADLGKVFLRSLMGNHKHLIGEFPVELREERHEQPLYQDVTPYVSNVRRSNALALSAKDAFNVLIVGPTGCGKSHLINMFFNKTVCMSNDSARSVTKAIEIFTGAVMILGQMRTVNIIDTIGLCDSELEDAEVHRIMEEKIKLNFVYLDSVVIMCSGRLEAGHINGAKKIMEWLKYSEYTINFTFIYSKADTVAEASRLRNLAQMCNMLETGHDSGARMRLQENCIPSIVRRVAAEEQPPAKRRMVEKQFDMKIVCGLNPQLSFNDVKDDLDRVLDRVFLPNMKPGRLDKGDYSIEAQRRIPVEESWCSIL